MAENKYSDLVENTTFETGIDDWDAITAPVPLPNGEYIAAVAKAEIKISKANKPNLVLGYKIEREAINIDDQSEYPDGCDLDGHWFSALRTDNGTRSELFNMKENFRRAGFVLGRTINPMDYIGMPVIVKLEQETYNDITRNKVVLVKKAI